MLHEEGIEIDWWLSFCNKFNMKNYNYLQACPQKMDIVCIYLKQLAEWISIQVAPHGLVS